MVSFLRDVMPFVELLHEQHANHMTKMIFFRAACATLDTLYLMREAEVEHFLARELRSAFLLALSSARHGAISGTNPSTAR